MEMSEDMVTVTSSSNSVKVSAAQYLWRWLWLVGGGRLDFRCVRWVPQALSDLKVPLPGDLSLKAIH